MAAWPTASEFHTNALNDVGDGRFVNECTHCSMPPAEKSEAVEGQHHSAVTKKSNVVANTADLLVRLSLLMPMSPSCKPSE